MFVREELPKGALHGLIEIGSFFAPPWALGLFAASVAHSAVSEFYAPGIAALIAGAIALIATVLVLLLSIEKRNALGLALLRWRHVVLLAVVFAAGSEWRSFTRASSVTAQTETAALWACSRFPQCVKAAHEFASSNGQSIYIGPEAQSAIR